MNLKVNGKNIEITDAINTYVNKKAQRLDKYFQDGEFEVTVRLYTEKNMQVAEMQVLKAKKMYKAEVKEKDLYASIDKCIDVVEGQIRKSKAKQEKAIKGRLYKRCFCYSGGKLSYRRTY